MIREFKRCPRCKQVKPVKEFDKNRSQYDGLSGYCKICSYEYKKQRGYQTVYMRKINYNFYIEKLISRVRILEEFYNEMLEIDCRWWIF